MTTLVTQGARRPRPRALPPYPQTKSDEKENILAV